MHSLRIFNNKKKTLVDENENEAQKKAVVDKKNNINKLKTNIQKPTVLVERKPNIQIEQPQGRSEKNEVIEKSRIVKFGGGDFLISVDYADDIDLYLRKMEVQYKLPENFLRGHQGGVDGRMRQILVDWLVHVQVQLKMCIETLSLAVNILDRSLLVLSDINKSNLQLLGVACLFAASKFEEIFIPTTEELVNIAANVFSKDDVYEMEQRVLNATSFDFGQPHSIQFLRRYRFYVSPDKNIYEFSKYICEVALVSYQLAHHVPSTIAAVALYMASFTFGRKLTSSNLFLEVFRIKEDLLTSIARSFVDHIIQFADPNERRFYALREKYMNVLQMLTNEHLCRLREFLDFGTTV